MAALAFLTERPIAHRGLHDGNHRVAENSMAAFRAALSHGFAIECDVHIAADGIPVVFHDHDLQRMTGRDGTVGAATANALSQARLAGTQDHVPTLQELLTLVAGRVPLVVELKGSDAATDSGYAAALRPVLQDYSGPLALMSFDDWLVDQALTLGPPVGLTAEGTRPELLARHRSVFERGCSFVSYNVHHMPNSFVDWVRQDRHLPVISWTVRTPDDVERSRRHADQMTFEGFTPDPSAA